MFRKIVFYLGSALSFFFLPIPIPWSPVVMFVGVLAVVILPTIGSAVALGAWIWAAIEVFSRPFSWLMIPFALFGIFCVIGYGLSFLVGIGVIKEKDRRQVF
ncbi:MAG: hypothetical protein IK095_00330 [Oscillospiraceae bacterium]|nr:hypothetical protein [Oscillospiraceae bacterium]